MPAAGGRLLALLLAVAAPCRGAERPHDDRSLPSTAAPATVRLESPVDYQVFQRTGAHDGAIVIQGTWSVPRHGTVEPDALRFRVRGPSGGGDASWRPLPFNPGARGFRMSVPLAPGGWYGVDVQLLEHGALRANATVAHVGIGEIFLIAGQSNSANYAEERQRPETGLVAAFDGARWRIADDPQPGATGTKGSFIPSFGDALVRRFHVPVGVVCIGVGGTSIREWMPAGHPMALPPTTGAHCLVLADGSLVSTGELFDRLVGRLRAFPPRGLRAVLWHQGESDWHQSPGHGIALDAYRADLRELIDDSRRAAGWDVPWFVAQVSYGNPTVPGSDAMRAQQRAVVDDRLTFAGPNTDTLTGLLREKHGQGVHFSAEGQRRHGALWAEVVGDWISRRDGDTDPTPAVATPRP